MANTNYTLTHELISIESGRGWKCTVCESTSYASNKGQADYGMGACDTLVVNIETGDITGEYKEIGAPTPVAPRNPASPKQIKFIKALLAQSNADNMSVKGPINYRSLSSREASLIISDLKGD